MKRVFMYSGETALLNRCQIRYLRKVDGPIMWLNPVLFNVHNPRYNLWRSRTCLVRFQNIFLKEKSDRSRTSSDQARTAIPPTFFLNGISGNHSLEMMILTMTVIRVKRTQTSLSADNRCLHLVCRHATDTDRVKF